METDQVHPAFEAPEQPRQGVGVAFVVVEAGEHRIFEAHAPLSAEIVASDKLKHLLQHPELLELPASTEVDYEV